MGLFGRNDNNEETKGQKMLIKYKFKELKVYSSDEWMADSTKKYRTVYDKAETTYMYAEFSFYNKLFDEENWNCVVHLKAFEVNGNNKKELCSLEVKREVKQDENIVYIREGWGNATAGAYWKRGDYVWEAYIDNAKVGETKFYVEDVGLVSSADNPYFSIESVKYYEGTFDGNNEPNKKYLKKFSRNETRYLWVQFDIKVKTSSDFYCELYFNFYDDAGQPKAHVERQRYIARQKQSTTETFHVGWGTDSPGSWKDNKYFLEVVFMDTLVAVAPFEVGDKHEEGTPQVLTSMEQGFSETKVASTTAAEPEESLEDLMKKLDELIGLEDVKKQIKQHIDYLNFIKLRKEKGFSDSEKISLHSIFTGNPGTGKTTVVNMLGKIYKKMGLLSKGHVMEVDRADLVGEYIGQTAPRTKKAIQDARGGILFIDEAYSLSRAGEDSKDFGKEVIEILLKEMSDGPGDIAIMAAGYPQEMETFINSNPGMKSRFAHYFRFEDYLPEELLQIAEVACRKRGVNMSADARSYLEEMLIEEFRNRDRTFGNARLVYAIIDEAKMNLGLRLMNHPEVKDLSNEQMSTIEADDMRKVFAGKGKKKLDISINEKLLKEALTELNALTGMSNIKEEVNELVKLVRFYREIGKDVLNKFSLHTVFVGNPGTGKTTMARIIGKIYKGLGLVERGHVVECDRQGLVASYVGQTANKTQQKVDEAKGGILFIDEAYALAEGGESDFGKEAIEVVLKRMEDLRGQFGVIVAGYPDNMHEFLESNPGLKSRFDRTLVFHDYSADELYLIAQSILAKEKIKADDEAEKHLKGYFTALYSSRDKFFGNARTVRQVVGEAIKNQNLRLASMPAAERTRQHLETLTLDDVKEFVLQEKAERKSIGFKTS